MKLSPPRIVLESQPAHVQKRPRDVFLCPLLSVWSARSAIMPINYVFQHLPTLMPQGLESYSVCAWDHLISYPSETSEGTTRSLEHRLLREVLVRIQIIYLLCPGVSLDSKHDFMRDSGISGNFDTIISVSYWDIIFVFTAQMCGKKKGWKVVVIEIFFFLPTANSLKDNFPG